MNLTRWVAACSATLALVACAAPTRPNAEPAAAPAVTLPKAASPTPKPGAAAVASSSDEAADPRHENVVRQARLQGYKPRQRDGHTIYCRSEAMVGSRLPETICRDEAQLNNELRNTEDTQQEMLRGHSCADCALK